MTLAQSLKVTSFVVTVLGAPLRKEGPDVYDNIMGLAADDDRRGFSRFAHNALP